MTYSGPWHIYWTLEVYSKPCQISTMTRYFENPDIVRTVYSGIFGHIRGHSAIFTYVYKYCATLRQTEATSCITEACEPSDICRTLCNPCIYNRAIFGTLAHLELEASSKACQTCKLIRYIQSPGIVRTVYSSIFKVI